MASVFDLLDKIRKQPEVYLTHDSFHRAQQLEALAALLDGYQLALSEHSIREPCGNFVVTFSRYLAEKKRWTAPVGPIQRIRLAAASDEEAWELFWTLSDDFRKALNLA